MRDFYHYGLLFLKGLGLGAVDLVPGVSGGTFALIVGIYEELLQTLQSFDMQAIGLLRRGQFKALWQHINGPFLLPLVLGMGLSMATTVRLVAYLLAQYPIQTWSFFFGLLAVSVLVVCQKIHRWEFYTLLLSFFGVLIAYTVTSTTSIQLPDTSFYFFLSGVLTSCAMLLPGISGSFILVLLGKYAFMLHALQHWQWAALLPFGVGVAAGLLGFARGIAWLLRCHHDGTLALLAGFMLGALNKAWPWQHSWSMFPDSRVQISQNLSPSQFQAICHQDPLIAQAMLWLGIGILIVVLLEKHTRSKKDQS